MEKQQMRSDRAGSQRMVSSLSSRGGGSSLTLNTNESKRRLVGVASSTTIDHPSPENHLHWMDEQPATNGYSSSFSTSLFNSMEMLGPSLLDVLTLTHPPSPPNQNQEKEQTGGEDTQEESQSLEGRKDGQTAKFPVGFSRSAILGKLADPSIDNTRKTQEYFAKIIDKLQFDATGLVLLQESTVVIFLETSADQFLLLCRQLLQQRIIDAVSMKVLASCDDNPIRILQGLYFKKVTINRQGGGGGGSEGSNGVGGEWNDETLRQCAVETFLNLIKFVKKIGPMPPAEIRKCLTNLSNSDQILLPANDLVLWLLEREELMTLDEFLALYDIPIKLELESERVWPVHPLIHY